MNQPENRPRTPLILPAADRPALTTGYGGQPQLRDRTTLSKHVLQGRHYPRIREPRRGLPRV